MVSVSLVTLLDLLLLTEITLLLKILASTRVPLELSLMVSVLLVTFLALLLPMDRTPQLKILASSLRPVVLMVIPLSTITQMKITITKMKISKTVK